MMQGRRADERQYDNIAMANVERYAMKPQRHEDVPIAAAKIEILMLVTLAIWGFKIPDNFQG
jgi:hypothetical protein